MKQAWMAAAGLSLILATSTRGAPFDLDVNGGGQTINTSSSSLPNLVEDLVDTKGKYSSLNGTAYDASVKYGNVDNAINLSSNAAGTSTTLTIPSTGFSRTFTGTSREDVQKQIRDFLLTDGSSEYAKFLKKINEQSLLGVVDGNPRATTAIMADHAFYNFGLNKSPARFEPGELTSVASDFKVEAQGGYSDNDEASESFVTGALDWGISGERFGLTLSTIFNYRDIDGASLFSLGFELGLPIEIIPKADALPIFWQITPFGGTAGGASYDLASGGTFWDAGVVSAEGGYLGPFVITVANEVMYADGYNVDIGNYAFNTDVNQIILKNGISVQYVIGEAEIDAGVAYTNFLNDAAIDNYWSPTIGVGFRFGLNSGLRIGYRGDFGQDYTSNGGEISLFAGF